MSMCSVVDALEASAAAQALTLSRDQVRTAIDHTIAQLKAVDELRTIAILRNLSQDQHMMDTISRELRLVWVYVASGAYKRDFCGDGDRPFAVELAVIRQRIIEWFPRQLPPNMRTILKPSVSALAVLIGLTYYSTSVVLGVSASRPSLSSKKAT